MNYLRAKIKRIIKIMKFDVSGVSTTHRQAQCKRSTTGIRLRSTTGIRIRSSASLLN